MNQVISSLSGRALLIGLGLLLLTGCAIHGGSAGIGIGASFPPASPSPPTYYTDSPGIPPGHMPPPGKCRIWYPDRPPEQQPPQGTVKISNVVFLPGHGLSRDIRLMP